MNKENNISKRITEFIREKLNNYLESFEFNMSINNVRLEFYIKSVKIRNNLLKKLGLPMELTKVKVDQIKIIVSP